MPNIPRPGAGGALAPLLPAGGYYAAIFAVPMAGLFGLSFLRADGFEIVFEATLANYTKIATSALYQALLLRTVLVGFVTAAIVVPMAFALAYLMRFVFERRDRIILQLIMVSLFSGYLVRIYAWRTILGKQGLLNKTLQWLGVIDEPLRFLIFSDLAIVITLTGLLLPLAVLPIYSAMANISRAHLEAARDLGSHRLHLIRTILVPMAMPGVRAAFAFAFLLAAGDFVTPSLVGGTGGLMIGNVVADQFRGIGADWPLGAALSFVTLVVVLGVYALILRGIRLVTSW